MHVKHHKSSLLLPTFCSVRTHASGAIWAWIGADQPGSGLEVRPSPQGVRAPDAGQRDPRVPGPEHRARRA